MSELIELDIKNYYIIQTLADVHIEFLKNPDNFNKFKELFIEECNKKCILYCIGLGNTFIDDLIEIDDKDTKEDQDGQIECYKDEFDKIKLLDTALDCLDDFPILIQSTSYICIKILDILDKVLKKLCKYGLEHNSSLHPLYIYKDHTIICTGSVHI